jgi:hypothetical protein
MKMRYNKLAALAGLAVTALAVTACQPVSFDVHANGTVSPIPKHHTSAPATTAAPQVTQSIAPSASIPGATPQPTTPLYTPPPATQGPVVDASVHRCKLSSGVDTLVSLGTDNGATRMVDCLAIPPQEANLLITLVVTYVADYLTHQPFNPGQFAGTQAATDAPTIVKAYT